MIDLMTARLHLSPLLDSDWQDFLTLHQHSDVNHFVREPDPICKIRAKFITALQPWVYESGDWLSLKITNQQQEFVGIIGGFCEDVFSARIQVGYMLNPAYQGLGYATEALTELLRWLQSTYQVHKAIAYCHHHNLASIRVLEKCGFVVEGRLSQNYRLGSIWIDEVQLGKVLA